MTQENEPQKTFYITTAISYVNGLPHLGHAYECISCDVIARYKRLDGYDVMFLTGTDEHGQKVEKTARKNETPPQLFCDKNAAMFLKMVRDLDISNDDFIRTTEQRHIRASQALWQKLQDSGDIYPGKYAGWYSVRDEAFFAQDELTKNEDKNGTEHFLTPSGAPVEWVEESSYFFRLSAYTDKILAHYEENPDFIMPKSRRNEIIRFVKQGLNDLSISRTSFDWGIAVPGDHAHIMYVWLDALTNYLTALGYPDQQDALFQRFWPADIHVIGKDILRFHAVYWPAFLMSAGLPLPRRIFGHGFLNVEGQKMSKSLGNVISADTLIDEFGLDQVRYFLMREVPYGNDGSFSRHSMIQRINADLANDLGNLGQRVLSMIAKNCDGRVPFPSHWQEEDQILHQMALNTLSILDDYVGRQQIHKVLEAIWTIVGAANKYVDVQAPWALQKTNKARMQTVLYVLVEVIRIVAIYIQPIMPGSADKLLSQLSVDVNQRLFKHIHDPLVAGTPLPKPSPLFPRHEP